MENNKSLIKNILRTMAEHIENQLELSFEAILENDKQKAKKALEDMQ